jgi:hypothetical protein
MANDDVEYFLYLKVYTMERIEHIDSKECKGQKTITIHLKGGNEPRLMLSPQVRLNIHTHYLNIVFFTLFFVIYVSMHVNLLLYIFVLIFSMYIVYIYM